MQSNNFIHEYLVFDIPAFCAAHSISRSYFYEIQKKGNGPRLMKIGKRRLISHEAAAEWRHRMEAEGQAA